MKISGVLILPCIRNRLKNLCNYFTDITYTQGERAWNNSFMDSSACNIYISVIAFWDYLLASKIDLQWFLWFSSEKKYIYESINTYIQCIVYTDYKIKCFVECLINFCFSWRHTTLASLDLLMKMKNKCTLERSSCYIGFKSVEIAEIGFYFHLI